MVPHLDMLIDDLAIVHAALGDRRASELLERACDQRAAALAYAAVEPVMEIMRTDPVPARARARRTHPGSGD